MSQAAVNRIEALMECLAIKSAFSHKPLDRTQRADSALIDSPNNAANQQQIANVKRQVKVH